MEEALHELDIRINSCGISDCPADWSWNTVGFPDYDLWTVLRGKGTIICGGEPMEITAGKSFLLCPNTQYNASHDVNNRLLALNVHFSPRNMAVFPKKTVCKYCNYQDICGNLQQQPCRTTEPDAQEAMLEQLKTWEESEHGMDK